MDTIGAVLGNSSIKTTFLDDTSIKFDDDDTVDKDFVGGSNNNGSGAGAFLGNTSIDSDYDDF